MNAGEKGRFRKVLWLVLDSVGAGELPDADQYGDRGADTLGNTSRAVGGLRIPNLAKMGLGNVADMEGVPSSDRPDAHFGRMAEASPGKDTTTGHWEMAGVVLEEAFAVFPDGFPAGILSPFRIESGFDVLGNEVASGTEIIQRLGREQQETGKLIVYTSADSVFQVAAHEKTVPLDRLYAACLTARRLLDSHRVGRVIARPFIGSPGAYRRTYNRRDFSMLPPQDTVLDLLAAQDVPVVGVGKIGDIFAGQGITRDVHTEGNTDGLIQSEKVLAELDHGLVFTNLVDFDMAYGHRRDPEGYARALEEVDDFLPRLLAAAGDEGLVLITADHGCDPTADWSTDHTREYVPLIAWHSGIGPGGGVDLGTRSTFADAGQTVAANFGVGPLDFGEALRL